MFDILDLLSFASILSMSSTSISSADLNNLKEQFSYAHIHAVVAAAGYCFKMSSREEDNDGIDLTIRALGSRGSRSRPTVDVQVKSTASALREDSLNVYYDLDVDAYKKLCSNDYSNPYILILVLLPEKSDDWLSSHTAQELCLRKCSYWKSFSGEPEIPNKKTIRVPIPKDNLFTVSALQKIMTKIRNREAL